MAPSFMDKARAAAQQAMGEAKKGLDQGQAKIDEMQAKRQGEKLMAALGAAFYAEQRQNGSREAVNEALVAVDAHVQTYGMPAADEPTAEAPPPAPAPAPAPTPTNSAPPAPPAPGGSAYDAPPS